MPNIPAINLADASRYARAPSWPVAVDTESRLAAIAVGLAANRVYVPRRGGYNENIGRHWRPAQKEHFRTRSGQSRGYGTREGWHVLNRKKTQRLYREEGLTVRKRKSRKRATGMRAPILVEARRNARWPVDFVLDQLRTGGASASST